MKSILKLSALVLALASASAFATPVVPTYTAFGATADTFGGTGIPNNAVATTTVDGVTLALTATARGSVNPAVTSDGNGVFHAVNGADSAGHPTYARWNFDYSISGNATQPLTYVLLVDTNPAMGNDLSTYVSLGNPATTPGLGLANSENVGFGFISGGLFVPGAPGEYGFVLQARDVTGAVAGQVAILVDVPEPASLALVGIALLGLGAARRRRG